MAEYIEREAVLALADDFEMILADGTDEIFFEYIPIDKVRSLPAASVRPVVLCRDCMMRQYCKVEQYLGTDGFCSNGEKREGR